MVCNGAKSGAGKWTFEENSVKAIDRPDAVGTTDRWRGIAVMSFSAGADPVYFEKNTVEGPGTGIEHPESDEVRGIQIGPNVKDGAEMIFEGNTITGVQIGLMINTGTLDLDDVLANNTFAPGSRVVGNMILVPPDIPEDEYFNNNLI
jgi:hypothetical protein